MRIHVQRAGLLTSVQDGGRWGCQALGVPPAGPMDGWSHRLANLLAGNESAAATLEITGTGPDLILDGSGLLAIAGAEFEGALDGRRWTTPAVLEPRGGSRLVFGKRVRGLRAYLAVRGGFDVPPVLGSRATDLRSGLGGVQGRAVRDGDTLETRHDGHVRSRPPVSTPPQPMLPDANRCRLRVLRGPGEPGVTAEAFRVLTRDAFAVSQRSDRMGYRMAGALVPVRATPRLSGPVVTGAIQVPPSGDPLLLMVERQTTGGYPIVAVVIGADLPLAGQLGPGDEVTFEPCGQEAALAALIAREQPLLALETS